MASEDVPPKVTVHPLVLLSTVDHYNRVAKSTKKRVVGCLLGEVDSAGVDITNSFAVPFEEDEKNPGIWFLDHNYLENMYGMFRKVNAKEKVVGWYSSGPKIRAGDLDIHELFRKYTPNPVFVVVDVKPKLAIPTDAYVSVEEVKEDGTETKRTFVHVQSEVGALEAEEVGVEHLLRDITDTSISTLTTEVAQKSASLSELRSRLNDLTAYLERVASGALPVNHQIVYGLQDVFNLLPNLRVDELVRSFAVKNNDHMLVIYLAAMIRAVIALHNLINNSAENKERERKRAEQVLADAGKEKADGAKADGAAAGGDGKNGDAPAAGEGKGKGKAEGK